MFGKHNNSCEHSKGWMVFRVIGITFIGVLFAVGFALVFGYFVMLLWNALMPQIFNLTTIGFWQAVGLIILSKLLFGSFGNRPGRPHMHPPFVRKVIGEDSHFNNGKNFGEYGAFWKEKGKQAFGDYVNGNDSQNDSRKP